MLHLIHVVPDFSAAAIAGLGDAAAPLPSPQKVRAAQSAALDRTLAPARRLLAKAGLAGLEICLVGNNPGDEIAVYARKKRLDLLVLGSRGRGLLKSVVMGRWPPAWRPLHDAAAADSQAMSPLAPPRRPPATGARRRRTARDAALWLALYLALVTLPLFALLPGHGGGLGFLWDYGLALGYAGLAMLGVQFALTARFRRATAPFGIDIVYYFHRYLAVLGVAVVLGHYAVFRLAYPAALGSAAPAEAPLHMSAGRLALALFALLIVSSLLRRRLRLEYDGWRIAHAVLAVLAFGAALVHLLGAGRLLDAPWKQALWIVLGVFWVGLVVWVRLLRPWQLARRPWRVVAARPQRARIITLELEPVRPLPPLRFSPGQFAWVSLRAGPFAMREHPFSIASSAADGTRLAFSIKALGDFTSALQEMRVGEIAYVDAPYGTFGIDEEPEAPGSVFVAGGVGIAPVLSMLRTLADRGDARPLWLFYGNRVWDRVAHREELEALQARLSLAVVHVLQEPPAPWSGERGFVTEDVLMRHLPATRHRLAYFLCGPTPMTAAVERALGALSVPAA
ncbi:MAG: universal stress protein [Burkholderiaceae bacterium]|nr:universal stress protein [Burkholderiaceae bacterium]